MLLGGSPVSTQARSASGIAAHSAGVARSAWPETFGSQGAGAARGGAHVGILCRKKRLIEFAFWPTAYRIIKICEIGSIYSFS
jgi:hypothetical protein